MKSSAGKSYLSFILIAGMFALLSAIIIPFIGTKTQCGPRGADASNIRQIAQSCLIYAMSHNDRLPEVTDVWDFARQLAESGGLESASLWISRQDPANEDMSDTPKTVLLPGDIPPHQIDPKFLQLKPWIAVPLGKLNNSMPATTPVAWTRGLQPDGTWAKHSPYGNEGGYVAFVGGNVIFYKNLKSNGGELLRFDGTGKTSNILEALPPGCRIGEYVPTPAEQLAWAKQSKATSPQAR